jgi:argininosuccinate lyase
LTEAPKSKMWGGRFERAPDAVFDAFQRSFPFDKRLLPYELAADCAWARALAAARILTSDELAKLIAAIGEIERQAMADPVWLAASPAEDVHHFVELQLIERLGTLGAKLHTGRSRNDLVATDFRMFVKDAAREMRAAVATLIGELLNRAERHLGVPMPGNTHLQHAQPILWSHFLHSHAEALLRDATRLVAAFHAANECPLGAGALGGTAFPIDRAMIARELGFAGITANSLGSTSHRDFALDYLYALSVLASHLSRLAADMTLFATTEFGFIVLPDEYSTGSSLMPQKKNPDCWELIRGKAGRISAALFALLSTLKGLPTGYQRDLQEDKEGLFDAHDQSLAMTRVAAGAIAATEIREERLREAASDPALLATEVADYLVARGVPFRQAHEIVGAIVREAENRGQSWPMFTLAKMKTFSPAFEDDLHAWLTVESALARRSAPGGTAPATVRAALADCRERLKQLGEAL